MCVSLRIEAITVCLLPFEFLKFHPGASPLATDLEKVGSVALLSGHSGRVLDHLHDLRVDLDVHIVSARQPCVALLYRGSDPIGEGLSDHGTADIDNPLQGRQIKSDNQNISIKRKGEKLPGEATRGCPSPLGGRSL